MPKVYVAYITAGIEAPYKTGELIVTRKKTKQSAYGVDEVMYRQVRRIDPDYKDSPEPVYDYESVKVAFTIGLGEYDYEEEPVSMDEEDAWSKEFEKWVDGQLLKLNIKRD